MKTYPCAKQLLIDFFVNNQQYKIDIFVNTHLAYLKSELSKKFKGKSSLNNILINDYILENLYVSYSAGNLFQNKTQR